MSHVRQNSVSRKFGFVGMVSSVSAKADDLLNVLMWSMDRLMNPTFRNLTDSYEAWAFRNGLLRQTRGLEQDRLIERDRLCPGNRIFRLTSKGRLQALGGRDPEERWNRSWDGIWRMVIFDVPKSHNSQRARLRRYLRDKGFGYLQDSVWITPDSLEQERHLLAGGRIDVESLLLLESRPCAGESDEEIVAGSWDFEAINRRYAQFMKVLENRPRGALRQESASTGLLRWAEAERRAWLHAVTRDPLLPMRVLPPNYLGRRAWRRRMTEFRAAGHQILTFRKY
jgi:phenylacetic acid degradation operon negative regulatory protein